MPTPQLHNAECPICPAGNQLLVHARTTTSHDPTIDAHCQLAHFTCSSCGYAPEPERFDPTSDARIIPGT